MSARQHAFLNDVHCNPGQTGGCTIVGDSVRGPEWVIVEWSEDGNHHEAGDVSVLKRSYLTISKPTKKRSNAT